MFFFGIINFVLANELIVQKPIPIGNQKRNDSKILSSDIGVQVAPFLLEGAVESFDYEKKINELSKIFPQSFCGTYRSYDNNSIYNANLHLSSIQPIGQVLYFQGGLTVNKVVFNINGYLNSKSNQSDLIVTSGHKKYGLQTGSKFISFDGLNTFSLNPSRLTSKGGSLILNSICNNTD